MWAVFHDADADRRAVLRMIVSQAGRAVLRSACGKRVMRDVSAAHFTQPAGCFPFRARDARGRGLFSTTNSVLGRALSLPLHCFLDPGSRSPRLSLPRLTPRANP